MTDKEIGKYNKKHFWSKICGFEGMNDEMKSNATNFIDECLKFTGSGELDETIEISSRLLTSIIGTILLGVEENKIGFEDKISIIKGLSCEEVVQDIYMCYPTLLLLNKNLYNGMNYKVTIKTANQLALTLLDKINIKHTTLK